MMYCGKVCYKDLNNNNNCLNEEDKLKSMFLHLENEMKRSISYLKSKLFLRLIQVLFKIISLNLRGSFYN